jgi:sulfonate transport system ATP-binding protein
VSSLQVISSRGAARAQGREASAAVYVRSLAKSFGAKRVLSGIQLDIQRGEFVVLLGPSGTGKTTLLRILAGLELLDEGVVLVPRAHTTVYQEPRLVPSLRVLANVTLGQPSNRATEKRALLALAEVGLAEQARSWPGTLSGGEAQRVALARALVRSPELLLLDEPFAALDALTRLKMQDLVAELVARHEPAVLLVTHDVDEAIQLADRILILKDGEFVVDLRISAPRPRDRNDAEFLQYRRRLLAELGVQSKRDREADPEERKEHEP